jgi:DNA-binding winged helix-turn-helix (wHTH) protein
MHTLDAIPAVFRFGRCELLPHHRELRVDGTAVHLGGRAFDLLLVLVEGRGKLVTKDEILRRVWPGVIVEENTLHAQISALRKAMATDRGSLKTISGHGYRFIAEVTSTRTETEADSHGIASSGHAPPTSANLAAPPTEIVGRDSELSQVRDLIELARRHAVYFLGLLEQLSDGCVGDRPIGVSLHYSGEETHAREHMERVLNH